MAERTTGEDRFEARLTNVAPAVLIEIAAQCMRESAKAEHAANKILNQHSPLPQWAVSEVLLSLDLLGSLLLPLDLLLLLLPLV